MKSKNKLILQKNLNFSIIIPNYNGAEFLFDCLFSLYKSIKGCSGNFEIIIIDNASTDESLNVAKSFFTQYPSSKMGGKIISQKSNLGFAAAINLGIDQAKYEYIVICNNDLTVEKNWFQLISQAIQTNKNKKVVTFFGTVLNKDGTKYESQGLKFFITGKAKNISNGKPFLPSPCPVKGRAGKGFLVWGAPGALVVYQKNIIQKIGLFDSDFFAYEEDVDLNIRLTKLKYKTLYLPQAVCYHLGGGTSNKMGNFRQRMDFKNWVYIIIKNYSIKQIITNFPGIFIEHLRNLSNLIKHTSPSKIIPDLFNIYKEIFINFPKMIKKRLLLKKLLKLTKL